MNANESALDVAREVAPGLGWRGNSPWNAWVEIGDVTLALDYGAEPREWMAWFGVERWEAICDAYNPDPRACLRAVLAGVHKWALDVARATAPGPERAT